MIAAVVVLASAVVAFVAYGALVLLLAWMVVHPHRARPTRVISVTSAGEVVLARNPLTAFAGMIGLLYDDESRLAVLDPDVRPDPARIGVVRRLAARANLEAKSDARACGNVFQPDEVTGLAPLSLELPTRSGPQPAWLYRGTETGGDTWVIHIHGMLAGRASALRSVHSLADTGVTSLVVSYPGDGEAVGEQPRASGLGELEWQPVADAVDYALAHHARQVFLVGWSLGASIALRVAAGRETVAGLALISPTISWADTIGFALTQRRLPRVVCASVLSALRSRLPSRAVGLPHPLTLPTGLPSPSIPTLIIHSPGDRTTPFSASQALATASEFVQLEAFPSCPHALEWNADPQRFSTVMHEWLSKQCNRE